MRGALFMLANYHTHTWRCKHANGKEDDYIQQAIDRGLKVLGFSDHTPYPFPNNYVSNFRMDVSQAEEYFATLERLKADYAGKIEILIGVEAEYYPALFPALLSLLRQFPCQYMIMGQHFIQNEFDGVYCGSMTGDPKVLNQYVSQILEGLSTGMFTYLAHPSLLRWVGDSALYQKEMERLCLGAKEMNIPLEINMLGLMEERHYPNRLFWRIAGEVGNQAILGCDAHQAANIALPEVECKSRKWADACGVSLLDTVVLRPIG